MKKLFLLIPVVPLLLIAMAFTTQTTVQFMGTDWDTAKNKAFAEGKLYFVDFDASYCATCRNMDQSTYMDETLASYIKDNVVALRVDVQDFDGVMWSQQYEVDALPTMLVFDEKGNLVKRIVGYKSAGDLLQEFEAIRNKKVATTTTSPELSPVAPDQPMSRPDDRTNNTASTATKPREKTPPAASGTSFMANEELGAPKPTGKGLYEVSVSEQASKGYGVQVGVFSTYEGVLKKASYFKRKYSKKTLIHVDTYNGSTVYKLMLGTFDSRRDAAYFRRDLRRDGTDGLIKDLRFMG